MDSTERSVFTVTNKADFSQFFIATSSLLQHTRVFYGGDTGQTHTNTRRPEVAVKCTLCISPITHPGPSFLQDPPGAVGSFSAPGDQVNRPSRSGTDRIVLFFLHVFLLGLLAEETPCEYNNN